MTNVVCIFVDIGKKFLVSFAGTGSHFLYPMSLILTKSTYFLSTRWQCNGHATECVLRVCVCVYVCMCVCVCVLCVCVCVCV